VTIEFGRMGYKGVNLPKSGACHKGYRDYLQGPNIKHYSLVKSRFERGPGV